MHYADIKRVDIANGEGVRVSLFVSGCRHHCKGCFNEIAWNFKYGKEFTDETINEVLEDLDHDYINGLSLLGGEPLEPENQEGLLKLVTKVKERFPDKDIWCYTGFNFEKDVIGRMVNESDTTKKLISYFDVVVDGKFEEDKKNISLKFRGSENQRIIDVKQTLNSKVIKLFEF